MINFIEDFVLLGIMILGVLHKKNATHLWNMLYLQGLFWILTATLTELPSMVCRLCPLRSLPGTLIFPIQALSFQNINGAYIIVVGKVVEWRVDIHPRSLEFGERPQIPVTLSPLMKMLPSRCFNIRIVSPRSLSYASLTNLPFIVVTIM